jgi:F-type H+-transporting ATPase subunit epsilon
VAEFDRAKIEALIAAGLTAQQAADTADEEMRLQQEIDTWRNLLLESTVTTGATAH